MAWFTDDINLIMAARHEVDFSKRSNLELLKNLAEPNLECSLFNHSKPFWFMGRFRLSGGAGGPFWM